MDKLQNLSYEVGHRYDYSAIDLYADFMFRGEMKRHAQVKTVISGITNKMAQSLVWYLNEAYNYGKVETKK